MAVTSFVNGLSTATSNTEVVRKVADTIGTGKVSANAGSTMVHGLVPLMTKVPWWCIVCYVIPIWGLVCIAVKTCRGGVTSSTNTGALG